MEVKFVRELESGRNVIVEVKGYLFRIAWHDNSRKNSAYKDRKVVEIYTEGKSVDPENHFDTRVSTMTDLFLDVERHKQHILEQAFRDKERQEQEFTKQILSAGRIRS